MASYLHTCYRIGEIERSVVLLRGARLRGGGPDAHSRRGDQRVHGHARRGRSRLELSYNHGVDSYELGTGYNHIAIAVDDFESHPRTGPAMKGMEPEQPPYHPVGLTDGPLICFVRDPDGYRVELIEIKQCRR